MLWLITNNLRLSCFLNEKYYFCLCNTVLLFQTRLLLAVVHRLDPTNLSCVAECLLILKLYFLIKDHYDLEKGAEKTGERPTFAMNEQVNLPGTRKVYEFYNAPIVKFWFHTVSHFSFYIYVEIIYMLYCKYFYSNAYQNVWNKTTLLITEIEVLLAAKEKATTLILTS